MKSGGAKNGNIASAWELCWESIMKSIAGKLMGGTYRNGPPPQKVGGGGGERPSCSPPSISATDFVFSPFHPYTNRKSAERPKMT